MKPATVILAIAVAVALAFCPASTSGKQEVNAFAGTTASRSLKLWLPHRPKPENYCRHNAMCKGKRRVGPKHACCFNRCVDVENNRNHCGACRHRCHFHEACCSGRCVRLYDDKRHCGACYRACKYGRRCVYGMCDYA